MKVDKQNYIRATFSNEEIRDLLATILREKLYLDDGWKIYHFALSNTGESHLQLHREDGHPEEHNVLSPVILEDDIPF